MITIYGISNCDSVKKARKWFEAQQIDSSFHDFRKDGITQAMIKRWLSQQDESVLLNKRSTSWKQLSDNDKAYDSQQTLIKLLLEHPTLIKRPVIENDGQVIAVGFNEKQISETLA
ncbi:arsenate reductase [bacterium]|nr:arsenate reductase [bacterium]